MCVSLHTSFAQYLDCVANSAFLQKSVNIDNVVIVHHELCVVHVYRSAQEFSGVGMYRGVQE